VSDALLEYAYRRIVELEKLLLVDVAKRSGLLRSNWSIHIERAGELPAHHQNRSNITSIACGWNKCPYRQSWTPPNRWPSVMEKYA
jgi:hypothetical protein